MIGHPCFLLITFKVTINGIDRALENVDALSEWKNISSNLLSNVFFRCTERTGRKEQT
jgi:hypothetical protein